MKGAVLILKYTSVARPQHQKHNLFYKYCSLDLKTA